VRWPWRRHRAIDDFARDRGLHVIRTTRHDLELAGVVTGEALSIWTGAIKLGRDPRDRLITRVMLGDGRRADEEWIDVRTLAEPERTTLGELAICAGAPADHALDYLQLHETAGESRLTVLRPLYQPEQLARAIHTIVMLRGRNRGA
jgi:hypothetical protein